MGSDETIADMAQPARSLFFVGPPLRHRWARVVRSKTMARPFESTLSALKSERDLGPAPWLVVLAFLGAWGAWMVLARVEVRTQSIDARVEVLATAHGVDARVDGTLAAVHVEVGLAVAAGDLLATLDDASIRVEQLEVATRIAWAERELAAIDSELQALESLLREEEASSRAAVLEQRSHRRHAALRSRHAREESERTERLARVGASTTNEARQSEQLWSERRAEEDIADRRTATRRQEARVLVANRRVEIEELRRSRVLVEGELETQRAHQQRLQIELERHRVRAPIAGVVGEIVAATAGSHVELGARIATVVPESAHRVVASFDPADALGRIAVGQQARVQVHGFPWAQYGTARGRVAGVSREPRDGRVRIELELDDAGSIPLAHGQPCTVEIDVETTSPARLLMRALGRELDASVPSHAEAS